MNLGRQVQVNEQLSKQCNLLVIIGLVLLFSNLLLAIFVISKDSKTVLLPMTLNKPFAISGKEVSEEYIELIARDLIQSIFSLTPANYEYIKNTVLKLAHPNFYGELNQQIEILIEDVKKRQISIHFQPAEMLIFKEELIADISGYLETRIGLKEVSREFKKYRLRFDYTGSQFTLREFYEVENAK